MKIAIVCDWLVTYAGAERVLSEILACYPNADLFSVVDFLSPIDRARILNKKAQTTFIQKLPWAKKYYRAYLPFMPLAIEQLDVSKYDLIISSSHAVAKGVLVSPDQLHVSYVHSPMRYAWDLQHEYLQSANLTGGLKSHFVRYLLHKLRLWDLRTINGVDHFITNSQFIARRVWKTYRRKATIIHPPVDVSQFVPGGQKENYYITISRMVPYKKIDLIVKSFAAMPDKKLIVIGDGPEFSKIKKLAKGNIELLGHQPGDKLLQYLQSAKAFVFAAEEDFGIVLLEAQAAGVPIIAYGKGGATETVRGLDQNTPTGVFFHTQTVEALCQAVQQFEQCQSQLTQENCTQQAGQFTPEKFRSQFKQCINHLIEKGGTSCESV